MAKGKEASVSVGVWDTSKGFVHAITLTGIERVKSMAILPNVNRICSIPANATLTHLDMLETELKQTLPLVVLACSNGFVLVLSLDNGNFIFFAVKSKY